MKTIIVVRPQFETDKVIEFAEILRSMYFGFGTLVNANPRQRGKAVILAGDWRQELVHESGYHKMKYSPTNDQRLHVISAQVEVVGLPTQKRNASRFYLNTRTTSVYDYQTGLVVDDLASVLGGHIYLVTNYKENDKHHA